MAPARTQQPNESFSRPGQLCAWLWAMTALLGFLLVARLCAATDDVPGPSSGTEPALKALTLMRLLPRIQWPTNAFTATNAPLVVVAVGSPEVFEEIETAAKDLVVDGHPVHVRSGIPADWKGVHVAFVGRGHAGGLRRILPEVRTLPVLLVGETDSFVGAGGMVGLHVRQRRIRIEIAREAASAAGIRFESSLGTLRSIEWVRPPKRQ